MTEGRFDLLAAFGLGAGAAVAYMAWPGPRAACAAPHSSERREATLATAAQAQARSNPGAASCSGGLAGSTCSPCARKVCKDTVYFPMPGVLPLVAWSVLVSHASTVHTLRAHGLHGLGHGRAAAERGRGCDPRRVAAAVAIGLCRRRAVHHTPPRRQKLQGEWGPVRSPCTLPRRCVDPPALPTLPRCTRTHCGTHRSASLQRVGYGHQRGCVLAPLLPIADVPGAAPSYDPHLRPRMAVVVGAKRLRACAAWPATMHHARRRWPSSTGWQPSPRSRVGAF